MFAVYDRLDDPAEIAKIGILASCEFDNACDLPIAVYSLELKEEHSSNGLLQQRKAVA